MNTEELLKPRRKLIADYPDNEMPVGTILTNYSPMMWGNKVFEFNASFDWFDKYPHLFQKLEWWQERTKDELPDFIKFPNGKIEPISNYGNHFLKDSMWANQSGAMPATEKEFLEQKNTSQ